MHSPTSTPDLFLSQKRGLEDFHDLVSAQAERDAQGQADALGGAGTATQTGQAIKSTLDPQFGAAHDAARSSTATLGGTDRADVYGAGLRGEAQAAADTSAEQHGRLFDAVPSDMTVPLGPVQQFGASLYKGMGPALKKTVTPAEADIAEVLGQYGPQVSFGEARNLDTLITSSMRAERKANGSTPAYARMVQLKGAWEDAVHGALGIRSEADDAAVAAGTLDPSQTTSARLQAATGNGGAPGAPAVAFTPAGTKIGTDYGVADLSDLTASHAPDGTPNPAFPAELQPRDRTRAASQAQVSDISSNLQPTTQTVTSPAPYGVSPEVASALTVNGLAPTPANALAADTLGIANSIAVMNGEPSAPISSVDISPETVQAHPDLFSGVRTVGDLQAKITAAAPTAGTTTSTTTTPGAPAVAGALPGYSWSSGAASGLDSPDTSAAAIGISDPSAYAAAPAPGTAPDTAAPSASPDTSDGTAPTTDAPTKHLSVPNWAGNGVAGIAAGSLLGPVGSLLGMGNTISGWMGGPTAADGINAVLSHPGAPTGVTGGGDRSSQPGADRWGSSMPAPVYAPGTGGDGSGSSSPSTASSGVSPYDPHAAAMAAYQAALAGMGRGTGSGTPDATPGPRPLLIRGRPVRQAAPKPLYRPMEDPIVRRALGLE